MSTGSEASKRLWPTNDERKKERAARKMDENLEKLARTGKLEAQTPDTRAMSDNEWQAFRGDLRMRNMGLFYEVYSHVFQKTFVPRKKLVVEYPSNVVVHRGNIITPTAAASKPKVHFNSSADKLWTLALINPDGRLDREGHVVHWLVGNIKGSDLSSGQEVVPYLQPVPFNNSGVHRYVFALYEQGVQIDFQGLSPDKIKAYTDRNADMSEFARKLHLTPATFCFFQSVWDQSVPSALKASCGMEEEPVV